MKGALRVMRSRVSSKGGCRKSIALALIVTFFTSSCARATDKTLSSFSSDEQKEIAAGLEIHEEILSSFYLYTEPNLNDYVRSVFIKVTEQAKRNLPYQLTVLASEKIYANAAPGGYVYITTGYINFLENESELAAVLAHEVGELQYQDTQFSSKKKAANIIEIAVAMVGGIFGILGALAFLGVHAISAVTIPEKSKIDRTIDADRLAMNYLAETGYDPQSLVDVLSRMAKFTSKDFYRIMDYYNARPIDEKRIKKLEKSFKHLDLNDKTLGTNRQDFLESTKGVREMYRPLSKA